MFKLNSRIRFKLIQMLLWLFYVLLVEWSFSIIMFDKIPEYFFCDILLIFILFTPVFLISNKIVNIVYLSIIFLALDFINVFNAHYYVLFADVFSLSYLKYFGEGAKIFTVAYLKPGLIALGVIIFIAFLASLIIELIFFKTEKEVNKKKKFLKKGIVFLCSNIVFTGTFFLSNHLSTDYEVNVNHNYSAGMVSLARSTNFSKFGPLTYYMKEILPEAVSSSNTMKPYFSTKVETENRFTGLLQGYNVIEIMIETGAYPMVNEYLTPNLYKMKHEGLYFDSNYCKNKTNVSEIIGILGSYSTKGFNFKRTDYAFPFSLPNMLGEEYTSFFAHNVPTSRDIYQRHTFMKNFGFDNSYFFEDLMPKDEEEWNWDNYTLDTATMGTYEKGDGLVGKIMNLKTPFYGFFTSLSMHGSYGNTYTALRLNEAGYRKRLDDAISDGLWKNPLDGGVAKPNDINSLEQWMMGCMCFDDALGQLIDALNQMGPEVLNRTIFVLYGDHDIYYSAPSSNVPYSQLIFNTKDRLDYKNYRTEMIFYNPTLTSAYKEVYGDEDGEAVFEEFTSPSIIVPTLLDLLGIDYNANFYLSDSIFAPQFETNVKYFYSYELGTLFNTSFLSTDLTTVKEYYKDLNGIEKYKIEMAIDKFLTKQVFLNSIYLENTFAHENFKDYCYY